MDARSDGPGARDAREALTREFRRLRPAKVRAIVEGEPRDIAIPGKRHKYEVLCKILDALAWTRIECLTARGELLGIIEADVEEPDVAMSVEGTLGKAPGGLDREHGLLLLMLRAQEVALRHQSGAMATLTDGYRALTETVFSRLASMEATYEKTLRLAHDAAQRVAVGANEAPDADPTDSMVMELLKGSGMLPGAGGMNEKNLEALVERVGRKLLAPPAVKAPGAVEPTNGKAGG